MIDSKVYDTFSKLGCSSLTSLSMTRTTFGVWLRFGEYTGTFVD